MEFDFAKEFPKPSFSSMAIGVDYPLRVTQTYLNFGLALLVGDSITETVRKVDSDYVIYKKQQFSQRLTDDVLFEVTDDSLYIYLVIAQYCFISLSDTIKPKAYYESNYLVDSYNSSGYLSSKVKHVYVVDLLEPKVKPKLYWDTETEESLNLGYDHILKVANIPFRSVYTPARTTLNVPRLASSLTLQSDSSLLSSIPSNSIAYYQVYTSYIDYFFKYPADYAYQVGIYLLTSGTFTPPTPPVLDSRIIDNTTVVHNYSLTNNILVSGTVPASEWNSIIGGGGGGSSVLNPTGVTSGTYGSTTQIPVITVGEDGRVLQASNTSITLSNTGVVSGTYGSSSQVAVFTVGTDGRIASASSVPISTVGVLTNITASNINPLFNTIVSVTSGTASITYQQQSLQANRFIGTDGSGLITTKLITWSDVSSLVGSSSSSFCVGNDSRLSNPRQPTGNAGGHLTGSYPNPDVLWQSGTSYYDTMYRAIGTIPLSDIEQIPSGTLLGNLSSTSAPPSPINISSDFIISGTTLHIAQTSQSFELSSSLYDYYNLQ